MILSRKDKSIYVLIDESWSNSYMFDVARNDIGPRGKNVCKLLEIEYLAKFRPTIE
jgi:hypothetical protein